MFTCVYVLCLLLCFSWGDQFRKHKGFDFFLILAPRRTRLGKSQTTDLVSFIVVVCVYVYDCVCIVRVVVMFFSSGDQFRKRKGFDFFLILAPRRTGLGKSQTIDLVSFVVVVD